MGSDITASFETNFEANTESTRVMSRTGEFTTTLNWEARTRNRLAAMVDRFSGPLVELVARDANEGDTRLWVTDFLVYALNFSKHTGELTTAYRTSGASIDYAVRSNGRLFAPIEVKPCGQSLDVRNLQQARRLALTEGAQWIILTSGRVWQAYHLRGGDGDAARPVRVIDVDLMAEGPDAYAANLEMLFYLTHEAIENERLDRLGRWRESAEAPQLADVVRSEPVVEAIRQEMRRRTDHPGHLGDTEEVQRTLAGEVITRGLLH